MTCRELIDFLMAYLDGELPARQRRAFQVHLRLCPDCRNYLASYQQTIALEKASAPSDVVQRRTPKKGAKPPPLRRRQPAPAPAPAPGRDARNLGAPESLIRAILKARKAT